MNASSVNRAYVKTVRKQRAAAARGPNRSLVAARLGVRPGRGMSGRFVAAALAKETGYVDLASATRACDTTGTVTLVQTISQGAGTTQRVGKRVHLKSLNLRGLVQAGTAGVTALATILIVYDRRPTGVLPAITDILVSISSRSQNNDDNTGRFQIVRRWDYGVIGNITTPSTGKEHYPIMEYVDMKNYPTTYKALATGAIGDIDSGAVYLVTLGDQAAGTGAPNSAVAIRTRFVDV